MPLWPEYIFTLSSAVFDESVPFVTPWVHLADTYARKGQVTGDDWIALTKDTAVAATKLGLNLLVGKPELNKPVTKQFDNPAFKGQTAAGLRSLNFKGDIQLADASGKIAPDAPRLTLVYEASHLTPEEDRAMYAAKAAKNPRYVFFRPS